MKYGPITKQSNAEYFVVETNFPDANKSDEDNARFGQYYAHAFTDKRDPGSGKRFTKANADVCDVASRYRPRECFAFTDLMDAVRCAERLREFGVLGCRYEHDAEWNVASRGMPLTVRIVEHRSATVERVVLPSDGH